MCEVVVGSVGGMCGGKFVDVVENVDITTGRSFYCSPLWPTNQSHSFTGSSLLS